MVSETITKNINNDKTNLAIKTNISPTLEQQQQQQHHIGCSHYYCCSSEGLVFISIGELLLIEIDILFDGLDRYK